MDLVFTPSQIETGPIDVAQTQRYTSASLDDNPLHSDLATARAAGLDGLLRVASFMALGFSLIGIGWVYSRQLRSQPAISEKAAG